MRLTDAPNLNAAAVELKSGEKRKLAMERSDKRYRAKRQTLSSGATNAIERSDKRYRAKRQTLPSEATNATERRDQCFGEARFGNYEIFFPDGFEIEFQ